MFCEKCGARIDDTQSYCPACGAGMHAPEKKKRGGKIIAFIIIALVVIGLVAGGALFAFNYISPEAKTARLIEQGDDLYSDKEYDDAIDSYREALSITPDSALAYKGIVKVYEKLEDTEALAEVLEEAYEATGDKYFKKELAKLDEELRLADIEMAETIRTAVLTDIADGILTGNGEFKVKKGNPTSLDETPKGSGAPAQGCNYYVLYDAPSGTVYVALNGFVLSTEYGVQEYLDYDGKFEDRSDELVWPGLPAYDITPDDSDVVTSADGNLDEVGDITITMWCNIPESDGYRHALECAIDDLEDKYPNVTLNWEAYAFESYKTKLKAAVAAGDLPDVFVTPTGAFLGDFTEAGCIYCLDDMYEEYEDELPECMLTTSTFGGKHYGVPYNMNTIILFANMDLLKEAGYDEIPTTYNDLIECCEALKKKKITPFGVAGSETWCVSEFVESLMLQTVGAETLSDLFYGNETWDNEDIALAIDMFQSWKEEEYFASKGETLTYDEVLINFENGDYAFMVTGTWNCLNIATTADFEVAISGLPVIDSEKADEGLFLGGPTEVFAVSSASAHPQASAQFSFELGRLMSHYGYLDWCGLPAWEIYGDTSDIEELSLEAAQMMHEASGFVLYGDVAIDDDDFEIYYSYMEQVYDGSIDGQGFIEGLENELL